MVVSVFFTLYHQFLTFINTKNGAYSKLELANLT